MMSDDLPTTLRFASPSHSVSLHADGRITWGENGYFEKEGLLVPQVVIETIAISMAAAEVERSHLREISEAVKATSEDVAAALDELASALDTDMPSDSGYVERVQSLAKRLRDASR